MKFKLVPILDKMQEIYNLPRTVERFQQYLSLLQGKDKKDMNIPIAGYNPMGSDQVLVKLLELKSIKAEQIAQAELNDINSILNITNSDEVQVVLNLADDLGGAWSNFHTTDFSSKFSLNALVERNFCAPYFWTGEIYSESLIRERVRAYAYRFLYWKKNGKPKSLKDHFNQEVFVQKNIKSKGITKTDPQSREGVRTFLDSYQNSEDYNTIFNFFYGDKACESLAYPTLGIEENAGFNYAQYYAMKEGGSF